MKQSKAKQERSKKCEKIKHYTEYAIGPSSCVPLLLIFYLLSMGVDGLLGIQSKQTEQKKNWRTANNFIGITNTDNNNNDKKEEI